MKNEEFLEDQKMLVPKPILKVWREFLLICNEKNLVGLLFQSLVNAYKFESIHTTAVDQLRNKLLLCWIISLIDFNMLKTGCESISYTLLL